jgi:prepilin-type N-terminal cleavage/methylation domain-containing protein
VVRSSSGLTLIEVLIAIVVLGIGIVALAGGSAMATRMIGRGKIETRAASVSASRVESLRLAAASTNPRCTGAQFASGGPVIHNGVSESWITPGSGKLRRIRISVTYLTVRGTRSAILQTDIEC